MPATTVQTSSTIGGKKTFSDRAYIDSTRLEGKKGAQQTPPPDPYEVLNGGQVEAVQINGQGGVVGFKDGKVVDANGQPIDTHRTLIQKGKDWLLPDKSTVTEDYMPYRRWEWLNRVSQDGLGYLATMGAAAGLLSAAGLPMLAFLGAGTGALMLKGGLNFVGNIVANGKGSKIDDDPALATTKAGIYQSAANAASAVTLALPGAYFATVTGGGMFGAFGTATDTLAKTVIQNHQAKNGLAALVGKNNNQDMVAGAIGTGLGVAAGVGLLAAFGPIGPLMAVPLFLGASVLANVMKGRALTFDNLSNSIVRGLAHQHLTAGETPSPEELKKIGRKMLKDQPGIHVGADATPMQEDPKRFQQLLDIAGDNKFVLDLGETTPGKIRHREARPVVNIALHKDADMNDMVHAEYTAQVLADLIQSEGYKKLLEQNGGDEKAASLKAIELATASTRNFDQTLGALGQHGWALDRTMITADSNRLLWNPTQNPQAHAPVSREALQAFMKSGELPKTEA